MYDMLPLQPLLTAVACSGHLAFAILAWRRRRHNRVAPLLAVLFLDLFLWNFAALAQHLSGAQTWDSIDRFFSTLMPAIVFDVVVVFVGRRRVLSTVVLGVYAGFTALALATVTVPLGFDVWWKLLLGLGLLLMASVAVALWVERA